MDIGAFKGVRFAELGGPEVLQVQEVSLDEPGEGEVLLKVLGIGMTQGDVMYRRGTYLEQPELPSGLGTEICGEVLAVGPGVKGLQAGDRVSSISSFSINRYPIYGEYALLPEFSLIKTPAGFSDVEGAGFSLAFVPMYLLLAYEAQLRANEWLVLNAAAATTSLAACQLAKRMNANVVGVVRNPDKVEALKSQGFDHVLLWSEAIAEEVKEITGGGANVVLDPVLGDECAVLGDMAAYRARIVHYGALAGPVAMHSIYNLAPKFLTVKGFTIYGYSGSQVMDLARDDDAMKQAQSFIEEGAAAGQLSPLIAGTFPLNEIVIAHRELENGSHVGKLVVVPE
jgi:NADPH:quinone reductase-like Zn-dependent oxidoreductase